MVRPSYFVAAVSALADLAVAEGPSSQQWAAKSVYQIMTDRFARSDGSTDAPCDVYKYCGGSWAGIIDKLDYIQDMGFGAIQISPVVENIPQDTGYGEAYHGYWPQNMYALNDHFGTAEDLRNLVDELHKRDMYLMVDVVINDMAQAINGTMLDDAPPTINWSKLIPFNEEKYYHPICNITDWADPEIYQNCWFGVEVVALPDLKTEDDTVVSMIQDWIKELVGNYSIDGLRIDATKHVNDDYLTSFSEASGVFTMGEVYTGETDAVCRYQDFVSGLLNYPIYFPLIQAFTAGNMPSLAEMVNTVKAGCKDFTVLGSFYENQDLPRFASQVEDLALAKNAMAFSILSDGMPIVFQGQEQHLAGNYPPYNREAVWTTGYSKEGPLYKLTATLNKLRNHAISVDNRYVANHSQELYVDGSTYATRKGPEGVQIVSVFSNQGSKGGDYQLALAGGFAPGTEVMEVLNCTKLTADNVGNITVPMSAGEPKAFYPISNLNNSGLCGFNNDKTTSGSGSSAKNNTDPKKHSAGEYLQVPTYTILMCIFFAGAAWLL